MKTYYEGHDDVYLRNREAGKPGWQESYSDDFAFLEKALASPHFPQSGRLLEAGCGAGNLSIWFARRGYDVYGADIAPSAIAWAKEKAAKEKLSIDFRLDNVIRLATYSERFFDLVFDGHCLHCIIGKDRALFLKNIQRILKPGGFFFVYTMCGAITGKEIHKTFDTESRCIIVNGIAIRYIGLPQDILNEIRDAGFTIMNYYQLPHRHPDEQDDLIVEAVKPAE